MAKEQKKRYAVEFFHMGAWHPVKLIKDGLATKEDKFVSIKPSSAEILNVDSKKVKMRYVLQEDKPKAAVAKKVSKK